MNNPIVKFLGSYGLACIILILLLVLTFLGTLEQVDHGIFDVQKKYFSSPFLVHFLFNRIPIPLPGGALLMPLLILNLICGGFVRIKKKVAKIGILVVHFGIALLLVSGFITFAFSKDGHMTLYEKEQSDQFQSYFEWEMVVTAASSKSQFTEFIVTADSFSEVSKTQGVTIHSADLPFDIQVTGYMRNCQPYPKGPMFEVEVPIVDGFFLKGLPLNKEAERNVPGIYLTFHEKKARTKHIGILWGLQRYALPVEIDGKLWTIALRPKTWKLPFTVVLDKFSRELHPRTGIAKEFMSDITKIEAGISQPIKISMNEPLRHKGFTLFQASWGPANAKPGDPLFSTFAVVKNPADKYPEYACIIIGFGLFLHFTQKLFRHIQRENKN